ncbi:hypothetical protein C1H76_7942 [Elsinoe australis]|uniref:Uncharacterized protein n=1 Tax=Elsinoe australis TaxID=40998 RepID=A0A4U7AVP5_9PEZI|nr:hypothetical protein C1H76_7942 [Elsinoe australis]
MANYTTEARASFQTGISSRSCSLAILPENLQSYVFTLAGLATGKWIDLAENSPQQDFPRQEHWDGDEKEKEIERLKEEEKRFEDSVERLVMGDAYDSMKEGKMSLKESQWLQMTYRNDW